MSTTIYKISTYVNWRATGTELMHGGGGSVTIDLSNYYTKVELQTAGSSQVNFANITNAYHNHLLGLEGGESASDDSSGTAGEYYHLDYLSYEWVLARGGGLWLEDSIGDLYTGTVGAGVYIDDLFIKNGTILNETGAITLKGATDGAIYIDLYGDCIPSAQPNSYIVGTPTSAIHLHGGLMGIIGADGYGDDGRGSPITLQGGNGDPAGDIILQGGTGSLTYGGGGGGIGLFAGYSYGSQGSGIELRSGDTLKGTPGDIVFSLGIDEDSGECGDIKIIISPITGPTGGLKQADSSITNIVYYDPTTGKLSYGGIP
jgi:hypothetical protein